jgi:hypothetical protein
MTITEMSFLAGHGTDSSKGKKRSQADLQVMSTARPTQREIVATVRMVIANSPQKRKKRKISMPRSKTSSS